MMVENIVRNMYSSLGIINCPTQLHLVGCVHNYLVLPNFKIDYFVVYILCVCSESNNTEEEENIMNDFIYI
jgi:hypothetical protein